MTDNKRSESDDILELEEAQIESEAIVETFPQKPEESVEAIKDQLLRALAEMENVRKRASRDREDASKYAVTSFARSLLSVADNLRRALDSLTQISLTDFPKEVQSFVEGVQLTESELLAVFEKNGIKKIDPLGELFDHTFHQAMFEIENTEKPVGTIVEVLQPGYVLHDRLLRPAMVGVTRGAK